MHPRLLLGDDEAIHHTNKRYLSFLLTVSLKGVHACVKPSAGWRRGHAPFPMPVDLKWNRQRTAPHGEAGL